MNIVAEARKAIVGAIIAGGGAAVQAITNQCGHPLSWGIVAVATLVALFGVYSVPNAQTASGGVTK